MASTVAARDASRCPSRRAFLRQSGLALAGMALSPRMGSTEETKMAKAGKKIRIGVVGGGFGTSFYRHQHPNCVVEAVSDLRPERCKALQKAYGCDKALVMTVPGIVAHQSALEGGKQMAIPSFDWKG